MIATDESQHTIPLDLDTLLASFTATLAAAQQTAAEMSAAFSADPTNRELAVDKLLADEQAKLASAALDAEKARLVAERRAALEAELADLNAQLKSEPLWNRGLALAKREAKARAELVAVESERITLGESAMKLDRRRELIREELGLRFEDRAMQVRNAVENSGAGIVDQAIMDAATRLTENRYPVKGRNENVAQHLIRYARRDPRA
ncbi:MAG: hypothetical protein JW751_28480 [Polyangiaceae bacterium]|nr:hypothetical protein [Polyangiaceae bacterium]